MASKNGKKEKNKKVADNQVVDHSVEDKLTKEQIAELKKKKKEMEEELDELKGSTTRGKIGAFFVFLVTLAICLGILVGVIKLNVGNFASDVMAPLIGDVPIARNILPTDLQKKSASELAKEQTQAEQAKAATEAAAQAQAATEAQAASEAAAQAAAQAQAQADSEAAVQAKAAADAAAQAQADSEAALKDYVDTYSKMNPKSAASVFDNMMPAKSDVVVKILTNLTPSKRASILSYMNVNNASKLTAIMEK
jgi:flagellar motility protein MotE (MotC chaperone)